MILTNPPTFKSDNLILRGPQPHTIAQQNRTKQLPFPAPSQVDGGIL